MNLNMIINIGNEKTALELLTQFKEKEYVPFYVKITNTRIKDLNKVIGRVVFKKDALYINSQTLYEIMQDDGEAGTHHHHGLAPEQVYNALSRLKYSKDVIASYDNRYVVITDVVVSDEVKIVIIVAPNEVLIKEGVDNVVVIITIYPSDRKNLVVNK